MSVAITAQSLIIIFNALFAKEYNTQLMGGKDEPLYQPAVQLFTNKNQPVNRIFFTQDYVRSALHEIAHWVIAGSERRKLVDYGYWYCADGRNKMQQQSFEKVEIYPQAIEWLFCNACRINFQPSSDNLNNPLTASERQLFLSKIEQKKLTLTMENLPLRAAKFIGALETAA